MRKKKVTKVVFRDGDTMTVIYKGTTKNKKIAKKNEVIVQTAHYSRQQFDVAQRKTSMAEFFGHDRAVCMDCPFSMASGAKLSGCYTHKPVQYSGMLKQLRSIREVYHRFEDIPEFDESMIQQAAALSAGRYTRFGTYGEPSLLPVDMVRAMVEGAKNWTGYTHQWMKRPEYGQWFMASTHNPEQVRHGELIGYRSFVETKDSDVLKQYVNCPASKEQGFRSNCSDCGLCSGMAGKGKKHVSIFNH